MNHFLPVFFSILFCCSVPFHVSAQEKNPFEKPDEGIQLKGKLEAISDVELIDKLMLVLPGFEDNTRNNLMQQSIRPLMMPPRSLGKRGVQLSYTVAACLEYYANFGNNYKENLSPDYITLSIPKQKTEMHLDDAFQFLVQNGTVSAAIMPFDAAAISIGVYATEKYTIDNFLHVINDSQPKRQKVFEARKALMRGNPLIIELKANADFVNLEGQEVWKPENLEDNAPIFPLLVVGFDHDEELVEVLNPWSPDWGDHGYLQIRYNDFGQYVQNGFVLVPSKRPQ